MHIWDICKVMGCERGQLSTNILWQWSYVEVRWPEGCMSETCQVHQVWPKHDWCNNHLQLAIRLGLSLDFLMFFNVCVGVVEFRIYSFRRWIQGGFPVFFKWREVKLWGWRFVKSSLDNFHRSMVYQALDMENRCGGIWWMWNTVTREGYWNRCFNPPIAQGFRLRTWLQTAFLWCWQVEIIESFRFLRSVKPK